MLSLVFAASLFVSIQDQEVSQEPEPVSVVLVNNDRVSIRIDDRLLPGAWHLADPDTVSDVALPLEEESASIQFCVLGINSETCHEIHDGSDIIVAAELGSTRHRLRITGTFLGPEATFDDAYIAENRGRIGVSIPRAYELISVALALTDYSADTPNLHARSQPYFDRVASYFATHSEHPLVEQLNLALTNSRQSYFTMTANALAFDVDDQGNVTESDVYNRSYGENPLNPFIGLMNDFSKTTGFIAFYNSESVYHQSLIDYYEQDIGLAGMLSWLTENFPDVSPYDGARVYFSPLAGSNQFLNVTRTHNYAELQAHMNFPYMDLDAESEDIRSLPPELHALLLGALVFTEFNHGFSNPQLEQSGERIPVELDDIASWASAGSQQSYGTGMRVIAEYLNWALISLYWMDQTDDARAQILFDRVDTIMVEYRGFPRFAEFSAFLRERYIDRPPGATLADLYPELVEWFNEYPSPHPTDGQQ
jgi:hypothetical protein